MAADSYSAHDLMRELLEMTTQRWVDPTRFNQITTKLSLQVPETRIFFLTQLREKVRQIPLKLFPTADIRDKMLEAMQQALDTEISREEGG